MASNRNFTKAKETVSLKTIRKWDFIGDFEIEDKEGYATCIKCKICTDNISEIRKESRRRGHGPTILKGILAYINGVTYIHKTNVSRHVQSGSLHDWAKRKFSTDTSTSSSTYAPTVSVPLPATHNIASFMHKSSNTLYKNHFHTALSLVMMENSFKDYPKLVKMQKKNGVKFVSGKDSDVRCKEFVTCLAKTISDDVSSMLKSANFFSVEQDGTESRKTHEEKEMVFAKICVRGKPVELFTKCQRMTDFGGTDANSLKASIDDAILTYVNEDKYQTGLVSACADGASVNLGKLNGALTQIQKSRPWLLIIHCSAHRIELAVKDAFCETGNFAKIDEMMLGLYTFFKNSGKCWRVLLLLAQRLGVMVVKLPKSAGTRFQVHKYRAIKALIIDYLHLCMFAENLIETSNKSFKPEIKAKLRGYHNQWMDYGYLSAMNLYRLTLKETAHLSYVAQNSTTLVSQLVVQLENTVKNLIDIQNKETDELPFPGTQLEDGTMKITAEATNLPANARFAEANKLTDKQKKHAEKMITIRIKEEFTLKHVERGKETVKKIKEQLISGIAKHLQKRLDSFNDPIFQAFAVVDHTRWDFSNVEYGKEDLKVITAHFAESLKVHKLSMDMAMYEWRELKKLVASKFRHFVNSGSLWQQIFTYHHSQFAHILLVIELVLCIAYSSCTVERGISTLNRQLTSQRTTMSNATLSDLLQLRINLPILISLDSNYEDKLIEKAVRLYTDQKQRRTQKRPATETAAELHMATLTEDTFLPTPSTSVIMAINELTNEEEFACQMDSDCDDSQSESDSESPSDIDI